MRKPIFLMFVIVLFSYCKNNDKSKPTEPVFDTTTKYNYPYTPKHPVKWKVGDQKYSVLVLNFLKKYIGRDVKGEMEYLADSLEFKADKFYFKGKKEKLYPKLKRFRKYRHNITTNFEKWMSAYYPESKDSRVTVWYLEKWENSVGKKDSIYYTDDVLLRQGKIVVFDEKIRHFPE